ncbi:MAG TPA: peptidoglycan-binding protein [Clostridiales bacterium]|nr:peptidoglycan-binding protein [Clostridiales bacterium]
MKDHKRLAVLISMVLLFSLLASSTCAFASSKPVLKKGMSGEAVRTLQANLKKLGFFSAEPTGYFGDITLAAVKKFQKKYNIPTTGVVASLTHAKLDELLKAQQKQKQKQDQKPKPPGLAQGAEGDEVVILQEKLNILGYMKVKPTGHFGPITESALIQFQKYHGIEPHGVADTETLAMIDRLIGQDDRSSRGGDPEPVIPVSITPLYSVKIEHVPDLPKAPYLKGVGKYEGVVIHYTDNPGDNARIEANFMKTNWKNAFVHEFIDADEIIQVADPDYKAWGAGAQANDRYIHLELCHEYTREDFEASYKKLIRRAAEYLYINQLGVTPAKPDRTGTLWGHYHVTLYWGGTNHVDPIQYLANWGISWDDLVEDVAREYAAIEAQYGHRSE